MKSKRLIAIISASTLLISFSSCSDSKKAESAIDEISANSTEELNDLISKDVGSSISELKTEYEQLREEINTYDKYSENTDKIEAFYNNVSKTNNELCFKMYEYSLSYAELIIKSDKPYDSKYDDLEEIYDNVYDDARDDIYDGIYDGVLDDIYDDFYDGILKDAYDNVPYDKWSDVRSDEYDLWSDTKSDVYDVWSDCGSDIYDFWSDLRRYFWKNDTEKAEKKIEDFRNDIKKLKEN